MDIVLVNEKLVKLTSKFASEVFIDYYNDLIGNKQATYMANLFLSEDAIQDLLNKGAIFKLVMQNGEPIGFIEYVLEKDKVFLSKFYVRKDKRHIGIGRLMLNDCIQYTKDNNKESIYLTVNKGNTSSIDVYNHIGFKVINSVVNDIGNNYVMDDYIMELKIKHSIYELVKLK